MDSYKKFRKKTTWLPIARLAVCALLACKAMQILSMEKNESGCKILVNGKLVDYVDWDEKLVNACKKTNADEVKKAYKNGAVITCERSTKRSLVELVLEAGDPQKEPVVIDTLKILLDPPQIYKEKRHYAQTDNATKPDLDARCSAAPYPTFIMEAIAKGYSAEVLKLLLEPEKKEDDIPKNEKEKNENGQENSAEIEQIKKRNEQRLAAIDNNWQTAFHYAARCATTEVLTWLFEHVTNKKLMGQSAAGITPLHCAVETNNEAAVTFLLEKLTEIEQKNFENFTCQDNASEATKKIISLFLAHEKLNNEQKKSFIESIFLQASEKNDQGITNHINTEASKTLGTFIYLKKTKKILWADEFDKTDKEGKTALHHAISGGDLESLKQVCAKNKNLNVPDRHGKTALHYAAQNQQSELSNTLLQNGADPRIWDDEGIAPCDIDPSLTKKESWLTWLKNRGPEILNNVLTGITTAVLSYSLYKPKEACPLTFALLTAGLMGSHGAEQLVQQKFTMNRYLNRNLGIKIGASMLGALGVWGYKKLTATNQIPGIRQK